MAARRVNWLGKVLGKTDIATGAITEIVSEADLEQFTSPTIVRIRGRITFKLNASSTDTSEASSFRGGLICANKNLDAVGEIDADDLTAPWLWYTSGLIWTPRIVHAYYNGTSDTTFNTLDAGFRRDVVDIDSQAMRKVERNARLVLVLEHTDEEGSPNNLEIAGHLRVLVKE